MEPDVIVFPILGIIRQGRPLHQDRFERVVQEITGNQGMKGLVPLGYGLMIEVVELQEKRGQEHETNNDFCDVRRPPAVLR